MSKQERRLLLIALVIFVALVAFQLFPAVVNYAKDYRQSIQTLQDNITRYQRLETAAEYWRKQHEQALAARDAVNTSLLLGDTQDLVAAQMQAVLREISDSHNLTIKSLDVPEFLRTGEWVFVTQAVQFENSNPVSLLGFLDGVDNAEQELVIVKIDVRSGRNKTINGTVKVTGFSRLPLSEAELAALEDNN